MGKGNKASTYKMCAQCQRRTWQVKRRKTDDERAELDALPGAAPDARRFYSFSSKRDWWLVALMWLSAASGFVGAYFVVSTPMTDMYRNIGLVLCHFIVLISLWPLY